MGDFLGRLGLALKEAKMETNQSTPKLEHRVSGRVI